MKQSRIRLGILLIVSLSLILFVVSGTKPPIQDKLVVRFLALTNDASDNTVAHFTLSNPGPSPVEVGLPGRIELMHSSPNNPGGVFTPTRLSASSRPLTVSVVAPKTRHEWRVAFDYGPLNLRDRFSRYVATWGLHLARPPKTALAVYSDWLNPTVLLNWTDFEKLMER